MKFFLRFVVSTLFLPAVARAADPVADTVVECAGLFETVSTDTEITSTFRDKVVVTGNGLKMTCDFLTVIAVRKGDTTASIGKYGFFKSLVATGNVRIEQGDRIATCGRAEIFPGDDKIVLSERPSVRDSDVQGLVTDSVIELYRGQRRVVIPPQAGGAGTRITLPPIKDLGYDKNAPSPPDSAPKSAPVK